MCWLAVFVGMAYDSGRNLICTGHRASNWERWMEGFICGEGSIPGIFLSWRVHLSLVNHFYSTLAKLSGA